MAKKHCEHCGASMVEYKRGFSKDLARCVYRFAQAGGDNVDVSTLRLTNPQYSNFQRLRFWGLALKEDNPDGSGKGGVWSMTDKGWDFVKARISIPRYAMTYRGEVLRFEGEQLMIQDITEGWWFKPRVVEESMQH
jgi:hypothetical protein